MQKPVWLAFVAPALLLGLSTMASAHGSSQNNSDNDLEATLVGSLADYNSVRLFKHHQQLFAVAEIVIKPLVFMKRISTLTAGN